MVSTYAAPVKDTMFILSNLVGFDAMAGMEPAFDLSPEAAGAVLEQAGRFSSEVLAPLNASGDREGCAWSQGGTVTTPKGFKAAFDRYVEDGWPTLLAPPEYGGQGLPRLMWLAVEEYCISGNLSFVCYNVLSVGAAATLLKNATDDVKARYVPKLVSGRWTGTMNLTEAHCGTDLSLIRTIGRSRGDGSYSVNGTKIFITSGEHDLAENIVHLVLAKTAGAPDNLRGLSLFLVPKFLPDADGDPGARNGVVCGSIEHKMGLKGSATCVMQYDDATGFLIGEEGGGLAAMFVMVNMARLHVGMQGVGIGEAAYQHAVAYARERRQGRALGGATDSGERADRLIVHPDIRRMLMECRSLIEGSRALCLWAVSQVDHGERAPTAEARASANDLVALLTPVVKGFVTDLAYRCATTAQQIFGGHGYIQDTGAEQFVRDARITMLYEGSNGIQALDLATRKIFMRDGATVQAFLTTICDAIEGAREIFPDFSRRMSELMLDVQDATRWLAERATKNPDDLGAAAYAYLEMLGYLALGWLWLRMALAAKGALDTAGEDRFHVTKIATARFYFERILPEAMTLHQKMLSGAAPVMAMVDADF